MSSKSLAEQIRRICLIVFPAILVASCSQEAVQSFTIGTGGVSGNYRSAGQSIARIVNKSQEAHAFQLVTASSSGSVANVEAIIAGDIAFGIAQADDQYHAVNGLAEWETKGPQADLRAVVSLYTESVALVAGADSGIQVMADLNGKSVDIGLPGSGTRQNAIDALNASGIDWEKDIDAHGELLDDRLAMLMHSELDAFFYTVSHPNTSLKFATYSVRGARFVPLENIEALVSDHPYYSRSSIPVDLYPRADNTKYVETIGVRATFLTSAIVPDDVVYAITKAVLEGLESSDEDYRVLENFEKESMFEGLTAPIHPGAMRFYQEVGLQVPQASS